jgi:hypothetical protein
MRLKLSHLSDKLILLFPHPFKFLLHGCVLVDYGVLGLKLIVVPFFLLLLLLVELNPGERECHF